MRPILTHSVFTLVCIFLVACSNEAPKETAPITPPPSPAPTAQSVNAKPYLYKVFMVDSHNISAGYGYNILLDSTVFIHQPTIPAIQGNRGFSSESQAGLAASLVIYKLLHNITPPSVSVRELDSLGVLN
ncbi:MAG: DUF4907 domain-containing protein [Bacteroidetes bacterium]|nr:DUF4907 domain-containing protein [Bacteroidota bacterium]